MNNEQIDKLEVVTEQLTKLSLIHPHHLNVNPAVVKVWFEDLERFSLEEIVKGFLALRQSCLGFPVPAHVVKEINNLSPEGVPTPEDAYFEAFKKCSSLSWGDPEPVYSSPAIATAVQELGGCMKFSEIQTIEQPFLKTRFLSIYKDLITTNYNLLESKQKKLEQLT